MRVVPLAEQRVVPWKNGRGTTREVLTVGGDPWDARLSVAAVPEDGPFSAFPGIDRFIAVRDRAGMDLDVDGEVVRLDPDVVVAFSGDAATRGRLRDGPVTDLNWMVRRPARGSAWLGDATIVEGPAAVLVLAGTLGELGPDDAAVLDAGERLEGRARVFVGRVR